MTRHARIPADVNRPDRILGPFTARQVAILASAGAALYLAWTALRPWVALPVFLLAATPLAATAFVIAVGHRDGLPLDRLLLAALRHRLTHARRVHRAHASRRHRRDDVGGDVGGAVPAWLTPTEPTGARRGRTGGRPPGFPARAVISAVTGDDEPSGIGVVDLGSDGLVVIATLSTVNLSLRTPAEQDSLVDTFARYLHSLAAPVQILVRAVPLDLTTHLRHLHAQARALPHPALAAAATAHRDHLARLAARRGEHELLTRQILLVLREPAARGTGTATSAAGRSAGGARAGEHRLLRRLSDAATLLAPLEVTVTPLSAPDITALLTSLTNPDSACDADAASAGGMGTGRNLHRPVRRRLAAHHHEDRSEDDPTLNTYGEDIGKTGHGREPDAVDPHDDVAGPNDQAHWAEWPDRANPEGIDPRRTEDYHGSDNNADAYHADEDYSDESHPGDDGDWSGADDYLTYHPADGVADDMSETSAAPNTDDAPRQAWHRPGRHQPGGPAARGREDSSGEDEGWGPDPWLERPRRRAAAGPWDR
jgi:hypothetical protein